MAKIYSLLIAIAIILYSPLLYGQNVGIGVVNPQEKLDVFGGVKIGFTSGTQAGTIRYNTTTNKFEGRDNISWKEFGGGGEDDWTKVGETPVPNDGFDVYHSGNVGIGTTIPLTKLHVKGNGAIAIRAETSNSVDTIPAISAINTIGIALGARTSSATKPAIYTYSTSGLALKAETKSDTMPAIWAFSDSSFAIKAETQSKEWPAIQAYNKDSTGYAFVAVNKDAEGNQEGGNAAMFIGDINSRGAIRNAGPLYGGSVAVNDGMTVGSISGATCLTAISASSQFNKVVTPSFLFFSGTSATYPNNMTNANFNGQCRSVTGFSLESTFFDFATFAINVEMFVRGQFVGAVNIPKADLNLTPPLPSNPPLIALWEADGGWYSTWVHNSNVWNGTDPENINWNVHVVNYGADTDCLVEFSGTINYNWGDSTSSPYYAAFGEVRASGKLYANSISEYGDVAEYFKVDKKVRQPEAGDVVSISKENPHSFVLSTSANDPLLAGVISENPSLLVNSPDQGQPIALTGRVKVKVNLEGGKIASGDAITSSSVEGIGMKADGQGMILGHALEAFDGARTDEGKIWILISRTQMVKPSSGVKIVQGKDFSLGGVMVSGSRKVTKDERSVFIEWNKQTRASMPTDVEFNDLVIDLTPFGGKADMVIANVNNEGFEVQVSGKKQGFQGFYYKAEIVSSQLHEENVAAATESISFEDRVASAKNIYSQWNAVSTKLESLSGKSLKDMPSGLGVSEIKKFKYSVLESWQKAEPKLYAEYVALQNQLGATVNGDASVMSRMK